MAVCLKSVVCSSYFFDKVQMNLYSDGELLQNALKNLREDKDRDRCVFFFLFPALSSIFPSSFDTINDCESRALNSIKSHVETALRELSLESFAKFESELYQVRTPRIFFVLESFS